VAVIATAAPGAATIVEAGENVKVPFAPSRAAEANVFVTAEVTPNVVAEAAGIATVKSVPVAAVEAAAKDNVLPRSPSATLYARS